MMTPPATARPVRTWSRGHALAAMFFGTAGGLAGALLGACFNPPDAATMFTCDPDDAPACPPDYACEADGCCHRAGSDVAANLGACRLGDPGPPPTTTTPTSTSTSTGPDATTGTTADSTGTTADSTGTTADGTGTTADGTSSGTDTGSTSASTTGP